jgi:hypothetical protein
VQVRALATIDDKTEAFMEQFGGWDLRCRHLCLAVKPALHDFNPSRLQEALSTTSFVLKNDNKLMNVLRDGHAEASRIFETARSPWPWLSGACELQTIKSFFHIHAPNSRFPKAEPMRVCAGL